MHSKLVLDDLLKGSQASHPVQVIAITGGKGGVGKTTVSVNLGVSLAAMGKKTYLFDADLGLANVDIMLGVSPKYNLSHVLEGSKTLEEIIVTGPQGLKLIPGSSGVRDMANLSERAHLGLIQAFSDIKDDVDVLLIDTPAGISDEVINFSRAAQEVIIVLSDEPTSITDAYALIKILSKHHQVHKFRILANRVSDNQTGRNLFVKLGRVCEQYLDVSLMYLGAIPDDECVKQSVRRQTPLVLCQSKSRAAQAMNKLSEKIVGWPLPKMANGHIEFFVERLVC